MKGQETISNSYKRLVEQGVISEEDAKIDTKIFQFLKDCTEEEICTLFDSGAFNDIVKAYCKKALEISGVDVERKLMVMGNLKSLIDLVPAKEIYKERQSLEN